VVKLVYSPQWFYGKDIIIDIISIVVLLLIAFASLRYYKIIKNRNYLFLTGSFGVLAMSFLFKVLMNINVYYKIVETKDLGVATTAYQYLKETPNFFKHSFFLYWFSTILGFYILFSIYQKQSASNFLLGAYLLSVLTYVGYPDYHIFHATLLVILALISLSQLRKYINKKHFATRIVALGFGLIALSQAFFVAVEYNLNFYVIGEVMQLAGYICLLITFIMVLRHGKKNESRYNW